MKSISYALCLLASLSVATAAELPHRPIPPSGCIIKNPKHIFIHMHGAYLIEVSTNHNCFAKKEVVDLQMHKTLDLWVVPGAQVRIEAFTGVGKNTKNQFLKTINDDYQIDCGGVMPLTNKCDYHKGPQEEYLNPKINGCYIRQHLCSERWECGYLRSTEAREKCEAVRKELGKAKGIEPGCYQGCQLDLTHWYCPTDQYPCKNPVNGEFDPWPEK